MRVLLLGNAESIHLVRWANALAGRGLDVVVASLSRPAQNPFAAGVTFVGLPGGVPRGYATAAWALRRLVSRVGPDLVNVHYAGGYGTLATLSGARPRVVSVWGSDVYEAPAQSRLKRALVRHTLRRADLVCSTSATMAAHTAKLAGISEIRVTPFGIDTDRFRPASVPASAGVVVGTVKTLHAKYGIDTLIRAFGRLRADVRDHDTRWGGPVRLVIAGGGPDRAALEDLTRILGLDGATTFLGPVPHDDVPAVLQRFAVYVAASRWVSESFGVAVLEASACGIPVVVSRIGGLTETVVDSVTGLLVPPDHVQALAAALFRLLESPDLRRRLGESGRRRVLDLYDWNASVSTMLAAYETVLPEVARSREAPPVPWSR